ncbi:MAG: beta-ketoacyl-[acyl-carrier-protein] synthase family protein [Verrucomicrobiota bacterium]
MNRRVVITGMGAVTPIGIGVEEFWQGLLEGRNGIGPITLFDASDYPCRIAAEVKDWNPSQFMERKKAKRLSRCAQFAVAASKLCLEHAGWTQRYNPAKTAVVGSMSNSAQDILELLVNTIGQRGYERLSPRTLPMLIPHTSTSEVAAITGFQGEVVSITNACAAGLYGIGHAAHLIRSGYYDAILCPATDASISYTGMGCFCRAGLVSLRNEEPEKASRPFDAERDGGVLGEGATCLLLESAEHAKQRSASIYAEIDGFGSKEAYSNKEHGDKGMSESMRKALASANCSPHSVDYIAGNGVSDVELDRVETEAVKSLFGEKAYDIPISSVKAQTGIPLNVAGTLQLTSAIMALNRGIIPPTGNYEIPDPDCDLDYVPGAPRYNSISRVLVHAHGLNGSNASLVLAKWSAWK